LRPVPYVNPRCPSEPLGEPKAPPPEILMCLVEWDRPDIFLNSPDCPVQQGDNYALPSRDRCWAICIWKLRCFANKAPGEMQGKSSREVRKGVTLHGGSLGELRPWPLSRAESTVTSHSQLELMSFWGCKVLVLGRVLRDQGMSQNQGL
jgi:hypothetical protein